MPRIPALLLGLTLSTAVHAQQTVVIPSGFATSEGNSSNLFPWGRGGLGLRHQCVYDSSHFTSQGINNPIQITGLKWRPNTLVGLAPSSYTSGCSVQLSTCPLDQAAVVNNFAGNRGADYTNVFSGPVSWGVQAAQTGPCPFGISIPLQTPFVYDPTLGDLNIECDLPVQVFSGFAPQLDVETGATTARASRIYVSTGYPNGTVGITASHAVVVEVSFIAAPGYAQSAVYGAGCSSQLAHVAGARPIIGTTIPLNTSGVPVGAVLGLTLLGTTEITAGVDLTFLGMPTCRAYNSLDASVVFLPAGGVGSQALPIPSNPGLAGVVVLSQAAAFVPGINAFGFVTSNGVRLTLDVH